MTKRSCFLIVFTFSLTIFSCSYIKSDKELLKEEEAGLKERIESDRLIPYKTIKILLRSVEISETTDSSGRSRKEYHSSVKSLLSQTSVNNFFSCFFSGLTGESNETTSLKPIDYTGLYVSFLKMKNNLNGISEDDFPTLAETFLKQSNPDDGSNSFFNTMNWNASMEHFILALAFESGGNAPDDIRLYETSRIQTEQLASNQLKPFAMLFVASLYYNRGWYYLSEKILDDCASLLESETVVFEPALSGSILGVKDLRDTDVQKKEFMAMTALIRGFCRMKMESEKRKEMAVEDFIYFMNTVDDAGIDNEFIWLAGAFTNSKNDDSEAALIFIKKLSDSKNLGKDELKIVKDAGDFLRSEETEKAANRLSSKLFTLKSASSLLILYGSGKLLTTIEMYDTGRKITGFCNAVTSELEKMNIPGLPQLTDNGKEWTKFFRH